MHPINKSARILMGFNITWCVLRRVSCVLVVIFSMVSLGCGGGSNRDKNEVEPVVVKSPWKKTEITKVTNGGLLSTNVRAVPDQLSDHIIHFVFLVDAHLQIGEEIEEEVDNPGSTQPIEYTLRHLVWDTHLAAGNNIVSTADIITLDNTLEFDLQIDSNNTLYVAYRGGNVAHCNTQQSDTMISVKTDGSPWQEYLGGMGYSGLRNPAYTDGDAGDYPSFAVDGSGDIHMAFQFFWEGCDSNNALHPDVLYVRKYAGALDAFNEADEEQVEGNDYAGSNYQNAVGYHNSLILDLDENPIVFHSAREVNYSEHGLRVARRIDGRWQREWVDKGCFVSDVSAAMSPEGELAVAYYISECTEHLSYTEDDGYALRYATLVEDEWKIHTVDEATKVGSHTQLAFDSQGKPSIAYYETESYGIGGQRDLYNLKLATLDLETNRWFRQRVDESGDIGMFNSLWFDENDSVFISSFSKTDNAIYLYSEIAN